MQKCRLLMLLSIFCWLSSHAIGQNVTGQVFDQKTKEPILGATVSVVGTSKGTASDYNGAFSLDIGSSEAVLKISYVGYKDVQMPVRAGQTYRIGLEESAIAMEEVVIVGFGSQKKPNLTGAVSTVDVEKRLEARPITDVARGLQGAVPGLTITAPSGQIGTNPTIRLRGTTGSLSATGNAQPLILLDNVEIPSLLMVNPEDIESITVLKDAASAAIYGTRAAWGVVLITTKRGAKDRPVRISYTNNFAWATPTNHAEVAPIVEGAEARWAVYKRSTPTGVGPIGAVGVFIDEASIQKMREFREQYGDGSQLGMEMVEGRDWALIGNRFFSYRPWDVNKLFMKDFTPQQKHDISVSGGSEKTGFNLSVGSLSQGGVLKVNEDKFTRKSANINVNTTVNEYLDIRGKIYYSRTDLSQPFSFGGDTYDPWFYLYRWPADYPYGTIDGKPFRNAITEVEQGNMNNTTSNLARINLGFTVNIIEGLDLNADYTYSTQQTRAKENGGWIYGWNTWNNGLVYQRYTGDAYNRVRETSSYNRNNAVKAFFTYEKTFLSDHAFKAIVGIDVEKYNSGSHYSQRLGLIDMKKPELSLATGDQTVGGSANWWTTLGYFGRINYAYKDRYLLELNGRIDGSSRFPTTDQWAFFPAGSIGWRISEEPFMERIKYAMPLLKIRASYGSIGNQNVGTNRFLSTISTANSNWVVNGTNQLQANTPTILSPILTWETVTTLNLGLDARFLKDNSLGFTFDWYTRKTSDMIVAGLALPSTFGASSPVRNFGEMETTGWEFGTDYFIHFKNGLNITLNAGVSDYIEKITKFEVATNTITGNYQGKRIGEIWGYETDRFFTADDFQKDANGNFIVSGGKYVLKEGIPSQLRFESTGFWYGPGDVKYKKIDRSGQTSETEISPGDNTVENPGDQRVIGNTTPRYQYNFTIGANWKGIDFSIFFQGVGQQSQWPSGTMFIPGFRAEGWFAHQMDYWTEANPNAFYPRPADHVQSQSNRNFLRQTKYLLNTAYLRCKNLTVGYTLPKEWTRKAHLEKVRVYFSGENLFEFDNMRVPIDPEIDYTVNGLNDGNSFGRVYPFSRSISFGLQITL